MKLRACDLPFYSKFIRKPWEEDEFCPAKIPMELRTKECYSFKDLKWNPILLCEGCEFLPKKPKRRKNGKVRASVSQKPMETMGDIMLCASPDTK